MAETDDIHLFCHRCGRHLTPGGGDFYVVRMEAFADPTPPDVSEEDLPGYLGLETAIEELIDQMKGMSEQEMADQVYRRLTLHLCGKCYRKWIEDPAGRPEKRR